MQSQALVFVGLLMVAGCASKPASVQDQFTPSPGHIIELHHPNGELAGRGRGYLGVNGFDPRLSNPSPNCGLDCLLAHDDSLDALPTRNGLWEYWYPSGQKQAVLHFRSDTETFCGVVPFEMGYEVKAGGFAFYHENGLLMAKGDFDVGKVRRHNICRYVMINFGYVPESTLMYDSTGARITDLTRLEAIRTQIEQW